jgi:hypothetical protein
MCLKERSTVFGGCTAGCARGHVVSYSGRESPGEMCGWPGRVADLDPQSSCSGDNDDWMTTPRT